MNPYRSNHLTLFIFIFVVSCSAGKKSEEAFQIPSSIPLTTIASTSPADRMTESSQNVSPRIQRTTDILPYDPAPSLSEISQFLEDQLPMFAGFSLERDFEAVDLNEDGRLDQVERDDEYGLRLALIYSDVSGDKQDDIIIPGFHGLFILPSAEDGYANPFWIESGGSRASVPRVEIEFQDYSGDGVHEIVYDEGSWGGGTGLWPYEVQRSIVHCTGADCVIAWRDSVYRQVTDYNSGGFLLYEMQTAPEFDDTGKVLLRTRDEGFSIHCCTDFGSSYVPPQGLELFPSYVRIYEFHDGHFVQVDKQTASPGKIIPSASQLSAVSRMGDLASVSWDFNYAAGNANDYCQLQVNGFSIGEFFGCQHNFTQVKWQDVTGDGIEDIFVIAYSAGYPYGPEGLLSNDICMHQRMLVFTKGNGVYRLIANVSGCVLEADLFGVKLEDLDRDGVPEIIAAPLYAESGEYPARVYRFNGDAFVMWSELPQWEIEPLQWFPP